MIHITKDCLQIKRLGILTFYQRPQWEMIVPISVVYTVSLQTTFELKARDGQAMEI